MCLSTKRLCVACMQGREKIGLVLAFTDMGFHVVVSDVDTVWLRDPLPFLAHYSEADILVSSDSLVSNLLSIPCLPAIASLRWGGLSSLTATKCQGIVSMSSIAQRCVCVWIPSTSIVQLSRVHGSVLKQALLQAVYCLCSPFSMTVLDDMEHAMTITVLLLASLLHDMQNASTSTVVTVVPFTVL